MVHEKNWRVSLCVQKLCHPHGVLWIRAAIPVCRNGTGLPCSWSGSSFLFGFWIFGWLSQQLLFWDSRKTQVSPSVPSTCLLDTAAGLGSIPHKSPRSCQATLSLDTIEEVMVGEVDELEEDAGSSISCLENVMDAAEIKLEEIKLEEELVDKPRTTIGTKFSVLHCIRKPFFMRCGFWPLVHS